MKKAIEIQPELVEIRRFLHENAECGFALDKTIAYINARLKAFGCTPKPCGKAGVIADIGAKKGKKILLRADMDGLPITEKSGEKFACKHGHMHACGHDMHTAMLLGAAKLLKEQEARLGCGVRLLFQPAEEILEGANDVIADGALVDVGAALAVHVMTDTALPTGVVVVPSGGVGAPAADYFSITVQGKGCHGSTPWNGVDATVVAAHILLALQEITTREIPISTPFVLTVGALRAGGAGNVIADVATLSGTIRSFDEGVRAEVKNRMEAIVKNIAKAFRAKAKVAYNGGCPTLLNDDQLSTIAEEILSDIVGEKSVYTFEKMGGTMRNREGGSEDFSYVSHRVPSLLIAVAAGAKDEGYQYPLHHPKVTFDERALAVGAAVYVGMADMCVKRMKI